MNSAAAFAHGRKQSARADWTRDGDPFGNRSTRCDFNIGVGAGFKRARQRFATFRLRAIEAWQPINLARGTQFVKRAETAEQIAAAAGRRDDRVGDTEASLFPDLVADSFDAIEKSGIPVVACIKIAGGVRHGGISHSLAR